MHHHHVDRGDEGVLVGQRVGVGLAEFDQRVDLSVERRFGIARGSIVESIARGWRACVEGDALSVHFGALPNSI